jgi:hypothetical protein
MFDAKSSLAGVAGSVLGFEASRRHVFRGRSPSFSCWSVKPRRLLLHTVLGHVVFPLRHDAGGTEFLSRKSLPTPYFLNFNP